MRKVASRTGAPAYCPTIALSREANCMVLIFPARRRELAICDAQALSTLRASTSAARRWIRQALLKPRQPLPTFLRRLGSNSPTTTALKFGRCETQQQPMLRRYKTIGFRARRQLATPVAFDHRQQSIWRAVAARIYGRQCASPKSAACDKQDGATRLRTPARDAFQVVKKATEKLSSKAAGPMC